MRRKTKIPQGPGFTLAELLVVIGIIVLSLSVILPSVHALFTAGADIEAIALMSAALNSTRGRAIENQSYALLHVQVGVDGRCWVAVLEYDVTSGKFVPAAGLSPRQMPGKMAFGEVTGRDVATDQRESGNFVYVAGETYQPAALDDPAGWAGFTTFNVIFSADGSLVRYVDGDAPNIDETKDLFTGTEKIWVAPVTLKLDETGVRIMTVLDYKLLNVISDRAGVLEKSGRFLCINPYTGHLITGE